MDFISHNLLYFIWCMNLLNKAICRNQFFTTQNSQISSCLLNLLGNCQNDTCTRGGILKAGKYLESKNRKYRLDFQNSGLHLRCGYTTIWRYGYSQNEALYFDSEGLALVLLNTVQPESLFYINGFLQLSFMDLLYKSVVIWNASTGGYANKIVLQDDGNLVLSNGYNKTMWETKTSGACPAGLEHFLLL